MEPVGILAQVSIAYSRGQVLSIHLLVARLLFIFSGSAPALTIFALFGVLFLGGVLCCRAPWPHNDGTQGPQLSEVTESQQQCSPRGLCSAEAPESGINESAGNTAECKKPWDDIGLSQHGNEAPRYGAACNCKCCLEYCEEQERASERPLCQRDCVEQFGQKKRKNKKESERDPPARELVQYGWSVPVIQSSEDFRLVDSGLAKRGGGGDSRVALESGTGFLHDKKHVRFRQGRIRSRDCPGPVSSVEAILGTIGLHSCHVEMLSAKRWACGG